MTIALEMSEEYVAQIDAIMSKAGIKTKAELLNNALSLFEWAVDNRAAGRIIVSIVGDSARELQMPVLEEAARRGGLG